jgi:hypothetical protein
LGVESNTKHGLNLIKGKRCVSPDESDTFAQSDLDCVIVIQLYGISEWFAIEIGSVFAAKISQIVTPSLEIYLGMLT